MRARYNQPSDFLRLNNVDTIREMMTWGRTFADEGNLEAKL